MHACMHAFIHSVPWTLYQILGIQRWEMGRGPKGLGGGKREEALVWVYCKREEKKKWKPVFYSHPTSQLARTQTHSVSVSRCVAVVSSPPCIKCTKMMDVEGGSQGRGSICDELLSE